MKWYVNINDEGTYTKYSHMAIANYNSEMEQSTIQNGADSDVEEEEEDYVLVEKCLTRNGAKAKVRDERIFSTLHTAMADNSVETVRWLVQKGFDINERDEKGYLPLHMAILYKNVEMVQCLIENGTDLNQTCDFELHAEMYYPKSKKRTPLQMALEGGTLEIAETLIIGGANVNEPDDDGNYPMHFTLLNCHDADIVPMLALLINNGADVNKTDKRNWTPLMLACGLESEEPLSYLIANGADVTVVDNLGFTPLHVAADVSFSKALTLIEAGADVTALNVHGETPLHVVSRSSQPNRNRLRLVVGSLIFKGSNVNGVNSNGDTPLHLACLRNFTDTTLVLLENKADVNALGKSNNTPLHYATRSTIPAKRLVHVLLRSGADVMALNSEGLTPLREAKIRGVNEIVELILFSKLFEATRRGDEELFEWVMAKGADSQCHLHGNPIFNAGNFDPLQIAAEYGRENMVKRLLDAGAKVNRYSKQNSPLHLACKNGHIETVKTLLGRGANVKSKNSEDMSPFHLAKGNGHWDIVEYLEWWQSQRGFAAFVFSLTPKSYRDRRFREKIEFLNRQLKEKDDECAVLRKEKENGAILIEELLSKNDRDNDSQARKSVRFQMDALQEKNDKIDQLHSQMTQIVRSIEDLKVAKEIHTFPIVEPDTVTLKSFVTCSVMSVVDSFKRKSCLLEAVTAGDEELVVRLLGKNPDLNMRDLDKQTPLFLACKYNRHDIIRLLVERKADVDATNKENATPLYIASENGYANVVEFLLDHKADVNVAAKNQVSPLLIAADNGHVLVVEALLKKGARVNMPMKGGYTPLYVASRNDRREVVEMLLEHGADANASSDKKMSPLHRAAVEGHREVVELLLEYGANADSLNGKKETPVSVAEQHRKIEVRDLIASWRAMSEGERNSLIEMKRLERNEQKKRLLQVSKSGCSSSLTDLTVQLGTENREVEELRDKARALNTSLNSIPEETDVKKINDLIEELVLRQEPVTGELRNSGRNQTENVTKNYIIINQGVVNGTVVGNCRDIYVETKELTM